MDTNTVNEILQVLKTTLTSGIEAVQSQFPILCEQILRWALLSSGLGLAISFGVLVGCVFICTKGLKFLDDDSYNNDEIGIVMITGSIIIGIISLIATIAFAFDLTKVLTAPNLVLLEALRGMVK
jgi:hypothetical protein